MATNNNLSIKIASQLPSYLQDEGPNLVAFMEAYYEWLESTGQVNERAQNLANYNDIDNTLNEFIDYFNREILNQFPKTVLADRRLLMKNIRDLYQAKGSENAFRLLFRLLYNEEILFYEPYQDVLKTSDGRWVQETVMRVQSGFQGDPSIFSGTYITGLTSGATAAIVRVTSTVESGIPVFTCYIDRITGTFLDGETIRSNATGDTGVVLATIGPIEDILVTYGGANNQAGDIVTFTSSTGATGTGVVTETNDTSINFVIEDGGSGYSLNPTITITNTDPLGKGASFTVSGLSSIENVPLNTDTVTPIANVHINATPFSSDPAAGALAAALGAANSSSTLSSAFTYANVQYGSISSLSQLNGANYTIVPTITVVEANVASQLIPDGSGGYKGMNAVITAEFKAGSVSGIRVTSSTGNFIRGEILSFTNQTRSGETSRGLPVISGVTRLPGAYRDTRGFLSWNNKLQDGRYYQKFSYVVQSTQNTDAYRKFVDNTIHPTGHKLFGEKEIYHTIDRTDLNITTEAIREIDIYTTLNIPTIVSGTLTDYIPEGTSGAVDNVVELEQPATPADFTVVNIPDLIIETGFTLEKNIVVSTDPTMYSYLQRIVLDVTIPNTLVVGTALVLRATSPQTIAPTLTFGTIQLDTEIIVPSIDSTFVFLGDDEIIVENQIVLQSGITSTFSQDTWNDVNIETYANTAVGQAAPGTLSTGLTIVYES